jgi:hypothetical protein
VTKIAILAVLLTAVSANAQPAGGYTITVHVSASHWTVVPGLLGTQAVQRLDAVIEGKKYDLEATAQNSLTLLALGDYKAKLVQDEHKTAYESSQAYEFLLPDKKTRKFMVVGLSE